MTLQVFPSVVWALDDRSEDVVTDWYRQLDSDTQQFIRYARDEGAVREHVSEFNRAAFPAVLEPLGLTTPAGTRVTVVLIAYGMGPRSFRDWQAVEDVLDSIGRMVLSLERVRIVLAVHEEHSDSERQVFIPGIRGVPWLLSTRLDTGQTLPAVDLSRRLGELLRGVLLAERVSIGDARTVFDDWRRDHRVKLFGYPSRQPASVVDALTELCMRATLFDYSHSHDDAPPPPFDTERRITEVVGRFRGGRETAEAVLRTVLGSSGLGSWDLRHLLVEGRGVLRRASNQLNGPPPPTGAQVQPGPPPSFWRRVLRLLATLFGSAGRRAPATISVPYGQVLDAERDYLLARLRIADGLIDSIRSAESWLRSPITVPQVQIDQWGLFIGDALRTRFQQVLDGRPVSADGQSLLAELRTTIGTFVTEHFTEIAREWQVSDAPLCAAMTELMSDLAFRYTGKVVAGRPTLYAAALSAEAPQIAPYAHRYRYWRSAGLVLFAASDDIELSQLAW